MRTWDTLEFDTNGKTRAEKLFFELEARIEVLEKKIDFLEAKYENRK
jgi:hypothetical protein